MLPPELYRLLVRIAGTHTSGPIHISATRLGSWTNDELFTFGLRPTPEGGWLAPPEWRSL